jgi:hypothetical protein
MRRRYLGRPQLAFLEQHRVREGATDVDAQDSHTPKSLRHAVRVPWMRVSLRAA